MKRMQLVPFFVAALALVALLAVAPAAEACYGLCVKDDVQPFCRICTTSPTYTGASCRQIGNCYCIYVDDCPYFAADEETTEPSFLAPDPNLTPMAPQPAEPADEDFDLAAAQAA